MTATAWRLRIAASAAAELLAVRRVGVLVLPGMWGLRTVLESVAETEARSGRGGVAMLHGGSRTGEPYGDLAAVFDEQTGGDREQALRAWNDLCGSERLLVVRQPAQLDAETAALLVSAVRDSPVRALIVVGSEQEVPPELASAEPSLIASARVVSPLDQVMLHALLDTHVRLPVTTAFAGWLHALTGGHPELVDLLIDRAEVTGMLADLGFGRVWRGTEAELRRALRPTFDELLASLSPSQVRVVRCTGLAGTLSQETLEAVEGAATVLELRRLQMLKMDGNSAPGRTGLCLSGQMLRWAVDATTSRAEAAAAWFSADWTADEPEGALSAWRSRVEGAPTPAVAARGIRAALTSGELEDAAALLASVPPWRDPEDPRNLRVLPERTGPEVDELSLVVVAAELAWAQRDVDTALTRLGAVWDRLWGQHAAAAPLPLRREASLLLMHIAVFEPYRATALLAPHHGPIARVQQPQDIVEVVAETLDVLRSSGLTLLPDLVARLLSQQDDEAFETVRRLGTEVSLEESALARLWLGASVGMRGGHERGRRVLSELLDELRREGVPSHYGDSVDVMRLMMTMFVGDGMGSAHVDRDERAQRYVWRPGVQAAEHLALAAAALQDDRVKTGMRHAWSAVEATADRDAFGLREVSLAMLAALAALTPGDAPARERTRALGEIAARGGDLVSEAEPTRPPRLGGLRYVALFAEGLVVLASDLSQQRLAALELSIARRAGRARAIAEEQQLRQFAVLFGSARAREEVLSGGWRPPGGSRARMVVMTALALAATDEVEVEAALETAEAFMATGARFSAHVILHGMWARADEAGTARPRRLIEVVLRARHDAPEPSRTLAGFAEELELTPRDAAVVRGLRDGDRTMTIAVALHLSPRTVEGHISRMLARFRCESRLELVRLLDGALPREPR